MSHDPEVLADTQRLYAVELEQGGNDAAHVRAWSGEQLADILTVVERLGKCYRRAVSMKRGRERTRRWRERKEADVGQVHSG